MCSSRPAPPSLEEEDDFRREGTPLLPTSSSLSMDAVLCYCLLASQVLRGGEGLQAGDIHWRHGATVSLWTMAMDKCICFTPVSTSHYQQ
ncbi:hypothetical protein BAE44_0019843 [Dichanthelium oligosanthes]|uniref:Uncharacterized protein n=1 Tax=Dichanthelium oligosanthes TaxID=888268 RepID=A0A1E5V1W2_9POAL|nr:hypothetical protein BAE44_0019843 [Dichanthelium oligosanthes]